MCDEFFTTISVGRTFIDASMSCEGYFHLTTFSYLYFEEKNNATDA